MFHIRFLFFSMLFLLVVVWNVPLVATGGLPASADSSPAIERPSTRADKPPVASYAANRIWLLIAFTSVAVAICVVVA